MPWVLSNNYCSLADVKEALGGISGSTYDNRLTLAINTASRMIDRFCKRRFYQDNAVSARKFKATSSTGVEIDDVQDLTGFILKTDTVGDGSFSYQWGSTLYQMEPLNGIYRGMPWAYTHIRAIRSQYFPLWGSLGLPFEQALVQVTAKWGWTAVPDEIAKACIVQSEKLFKADDAALGSTGNAETGIIRISRDLHPTAAAICEDFRRDALLVA